MLSRFFSGTRVSRMVREGLERAGYSLTRADSYEADERDTYAAVRPYTMTGADRVAGLVRAVAYIAENRVPGDIVECGVWRGGSMMAVARTLVAAGDTSRTLYLFDTFEGMTAPSADDVAHTGVKASSLMDRTARRAGDTVWCIAEMEDVRKNVLSTGYPEDRVRFVRGRVEDTLPESAPEQIALLRLDTDWYASTRHELDHLYPRVVPNGVLIVDDYGHWRGSRKAVDTYFDTAGAGRCCCAWTTAGASR